MRSRFGNGTKVLIALGGWGDTAGFSAGAADSRSRALFAKNVAEMLDTHDFDGVDIDVKSLFLYCYTSFKCSYS